LKMKERTITPVKDINHMVDNMTLKGRWKMSFYKGTEVTIIEQTDDNFIKVPKSPELNKLMTTLLVSLNEQYTCLLDTNNEYHEHNCVDVIGTIVAIGNIVPVNGYGCSKIRMTVLIEDAQ
ncbi:hypothetical protein Tco_1190568, partial [Tanacetum coccineum]